MCAASVILDYGSKIERTKWTEDSFNQFKLILDEIKILDERIGEPNCEDKEKEKWMDLVENMLMKRGKMIPTEVKEEDLPQWLKDMKAHRHI